MSDFDPPHLIYARGAENIVIEGSGSINGNGDATYPDHQPHERRPSLLIELVECKNVRIRVHIRNTGTGHPPARLRWHLDPRHFHRKSDAGAEH